jgi:hypothetical protein
MAIAGSQYIIDFTTEAAEAPWVDGAWTNVNESFEVISGGLRPNGFVQAAAKYNSVANLPVIKAKITITVNGGTSSDPLGAAIIDDATGALYCIQINGVGATAGTLRYRATGAGAPSGLGAAFNIATAAPTDEFEIWYEPSTGTLSAVQNDVVLATRVDTSLQSSSLRVGIYGNAQNNNGRLIGLFGADFASSLQVVDSYPATVRSGQTGIAYNTTGLTSVSGITIGALAATSISDSSGDGTHAIPTLVDETAHELYGTKTVTINGAGGSPSVSRSFLPPTGHVYATLGNNIDYTTTGIVHNFSPTAVETDQIVTPSALTPNDRGQASGEAGVYNCWHIQASTRIARSYTVTLGSADTTPDPFTFIDATGVALSVLAESNVITVSGITAPAAISVTGGEYSVNTGSGFGAYTTTPATIANGNTARVRHTSSASYSTAVNTVLTIGGVSDTFTTTTLAADTTPNSFTFTDVSNASLSTEYTSNSITVAGLNTSSEISISGGTYSKNGGAYTASSGTVVNSDTVSVRVTSSALNSTAVNATLTIGGVSDTYTVTTLAASPPSPSSNIDKRFIMEFISSSAKASKPLGYQQITNLSSAVSLTVPLGTVYIIFKPNAQAIRYRDDGVNPTASLGYPVAAGSEYIYTGACPTALRLIETTAGATLDVLYYGT